MSVGGLALSLGCVGFSGDPEIASCAAGMLRVAAPEGEGCLRALEAEPRFARWMAENGAPDYVEAESGERVRFFYIDRDAVVSFPEGFLTGLLGNPEPSVQGRIRSGDHTRFSDADRARLGAARLGSVDVPADEDPQPGGGIRRARVGEDR